MSALDVFMFEQVDRVRRMDWTPRQTFRLSGRPNPRALPKLPSLQEAPWHGTYGGYTTHKCRCPECREANAEKKREIRRQKRAEAKAQQQTVERTLRWFSARAR